MPLPPFRNRKLVVGVSGGADSTALLLLLSRHPSIGPKRLVAAHVNYRLRGRASDLDEKHVRDFCARLGVSLKILKLKKRSASPSSLQDWARDVRYRFFAQTAKKVRAWGCAVAHHREDQAETVLDRVVRGAGLRGLSAMGPVATLALPFPLKGEWKSGRSKASVRVWRPLLGLPKLELEKYLSSQGTAWRKDGSNQKDAYRRNRLRHRVLPLLRELNPKVDEALCRLAETASAEDEWLDDQAREAIDRTVRARKNSVVEVDAARFKREPLALKRRLVRLLAEGLNSNARGLKLDRIEEIRRIWEGALSGPLDMGFGLTVWNRDKRAGLSLKKAGPHIR